MAGTEQAQSEQAGVVAKVVDELHAMLTSMELLPGQALRQEALAARLGVSRAPVREALRVLESEGILHYERNVGYTVKRLTVAEFEQTYLMRRALESEVLRALPPLTEAQLGQLDQVNQQIERAATLSDMVTVHRLNDEFHFLVFQASGLDLVVDELRRIWKLSNSYRSAYLLHDRGARQRIVHEHGAMIEALRHGDSEQLIALMDNHRVGTSTQVGVLLAGSTDLESPSS
ncbi:GntR family transcriptional regulator [Kitasatospora saccharophila]|uniref:GntR family transcriptional regulator n=1 Tax=Kitasatospora saccharophila TaxID=407973 RepID=A0ABP5K3S2_9ACTN